MKTPRSILGNVLLVLLVFGAWGTVAGARTVDTRGSRGSGHLDVADRDAIKTLIAHDIGNVRMTLANWGEVGNPDGVPGFKGFEFPINSGNDFLFSAGIWVGAEIDGSRLVSTATDGDNGTNEMYPVHVGTIPFGNILYGDWFVTSKSLFQFGDREFIKGGKGTDDDGDWNADTDDLNGDGLPSANWDGGKGLLGVDDDRDGARDEEVNNGVDDDGDGKIDEDTDETGDANGDGNCNYDPEPHIDEDPAGDMSHDYLDNDFDGLVDFPADPDADGDRAVGFNDDDGDVEEDEDGNARGVQEYYTVFQDDIEPQFVGSPDGGDGHRPLRIQVLQRTYAFPEDYAADFILLDYRIRNMRPLPLEKVFIALFSDPDLLAAGEPGDAGSLDDFNYYDPNNLMMIQYDDIADADGPGPGIFAIRVVRTPVALESLKVTFANFERTAGGDPQFNSDKYNLISSGRIAPPTEEAGDWRMLIAFGDRENDGFTIPPRGELPITVAFIAGTDTADGAKNADWALKIYLNDFQGPSAPDPPRFELDTYGDFVRVRWWPNAELSKDVISERYDFEGYLIERSTDQQTWQTIAYYDIIDRLDTIMYRPDSIRIDPERRFFEWQNYNKGMPRERGDTIRYRYEEQVGDTMIMVDSLLYAFEDHDLIPGHTYHYSVRAFDKGEPGAGILYSGRTGYVQTSIIARNASTGAPTSLQGIYVFPNPYKGSHPGEQGGQINPTKGLIEYPRKLYFMGLPANSIPDACVIRVFSLAGDHLATIDHTNGTEYDQWDLITKNKQEIVSGIYYYIVEYRKPTGGTEHFVDKFVVIK